MKAPAWVKNEAVAAYGSINTLLGAIVALGVPLTEKQIGGILAIANVILAPIVRQLVTPVTPVTPVDTK